MTTRPRQWPKNLLVFAAPLAGASLGRNHGFGYALLAMFAFGCASAAVYFVNDVADVDRDRRHPVKRNRPIASGALPEQHAIVLAVFAAVFAVGAGVVIREPLLVATASTYLCLSFLYSFKLKHVPFVEMLIVASGFVLRVLGGAAATHVKPSVWFLLVCSLGALGVTVAKRYTELTSLGADAIKHRPVMRWYRPDMLRLAQVVIGVGMLATYLMWALSEPSAPRPWHLASVLPLAAALFRFGVLTARRSVRPVEDLITRDAVMLCCEAVWLILFCVGLYVELTMRVLLLGGTSEIGLAILSALRLGPDAEVILAGRDPQRLEAAGKSLNRPVTVARYDAMETGSHQAFAEEVGAGGVPDLVIAATGILIPQEQAERDVRLAATMIETNFTGHVTALLAFGEAMRRRGSGTIVVLSSVAAVRPRKFNSVYGATKAALDAFARGYADSLHGTGVRVLLVRPGFVTGRMTEGMKAAPLATTPGAIGAAVASALRNQGRGGRKSVVWVPAPLAGLATVMKLIPRPVWRKLES